MANVTLDQLTPAGNAEETDLIIIRKANKDYKLTLAQLKALVFPPDAAVDTAGLVNMIAQTFAGKKTFNGGIASTTIETSSNGSIGGNLSVSETLSAKNITDNRGNKVALKADVDEFYSEFQDLGDVVQEHTNILYEIPTRLTNLENNKLDKSSMSLSGTTLTITLSSNTQSGGSAY